MNLKILSIVEATFTASGLYELMTASRANTAYCDWPMPFMYP